MGGGYRFGGPHNKVYSILGSMLGLPYLWKLPKLPSRSGQPLCCLRESPSNEGGADGAEACFQAYFELLMGPP